MNAEYPVNRLDGLRMKRPADERRWQWQELKSHAEIERQPHSVLVVDDEIQMCELMSLYLGWKGLEVRTARTPGDALSHAGETRFDLVILDWDLAGVESLDLLNFFKGTTPQTSVIIFTGKEVDEPFLKKMLSGKADAILPKLGSLETLWQEIVRQLSQRPGPGGGRDLPERRGLREEEG